MNVNIQKYRALLKAVDCGSFTKAAEMLNYSQSGISRMIQDLEKEWNVSLLERGKSGLRLTSDGVKILPYAKRICDDYDKLQIQIDELNGLRTGMIRIGTFSSVATHWLPNMIFEFQKDYPNVDYELLLGDYKEIESWILEGRVDFGFLRLPTLSQLDTVFLEKDPMMVVMPESHVFTEVEKVPIEALEKYPFMLLEKGEKTEISEFFEKYDISPKIRFTTWDDYAIMSMVEHGLGISILPKLILQRVPYRIVMKELSVPLHREIGLAFRNKNNISLAVKKFLEYLPFRSCFDKNTE